MPPITCNMSACRFNEKGSCKAPAVVFNYIPHYGFSCEGESWRSGVHNWKEEPCGEALREKE